MAEVPTYQRSIQVQAPGVPQVGIEPVTSASSGADVAEAAAGVGKNVEDIGVQLGRHMVMQERLTDQQNAYTKHEAFKAKLQNLLDDPENGILAKNQGINAPNAVHEFDDLINGVKEQPGKRGTTPLRDEFMKDASPYERAHLQKLFAETESAYRSKIINHALTQKEAADQQVTEAKFDSIKNDAALVTTTPADDPARPGHLIPSITLHENAARDAVLNDIHLKMKGVPPEKLKQLAQEHVDEVAKIAVETNAPKNWEDAQKILDASSASPLAREAIQGKVNGARIDQYAEGLSRAVVSDSSLRAPDGQIDEAKANRFIQSSIATAEADEHPLPPGHADSISSKLQSQIAIQNKAITQHQQIVLAKASNDIYGAQQSGMQPTEAYDKFIKKGQFDNAIERGKAEDVFTKVYEKDASALETVWSHMTEAQKTAISQIEGRRDFQDKFSYPDEKRAFLDSLKQRIIEGRVQGPDAINKLYLEQIKNAETGAPRFLGFGKQTQAQYQIDESLQKNQPVVKALGGLSAATALARTLGGPDKLAPDTNESKAVLALKADNYPINADSISRFIAKRPDLLK